MIKPSSNVTKSRARRKMNTLRLPYEIRNVQNKDIDRGRKKMVAMRTGNPTRNLIDPLLGASHLIDCGHFEFGGGGEVLDSDSDKHDGDVGEERGEEEDEGRAGDASRATPANPRSAQSHFFL